jgi:hypothetical protein
VGGLGRGYAEFSKYPAFRQEKVKSSIHAGKKISYA